MSENARVPQAHWPRLPWLPGPVLSWDVASSDVHHSGGKFSLEDARIGPMKSQLPCPDPKQGEPHPKALLRGRRAWMVICELRDSQ